MDSARALHAASIFMPFGIELVRVRDVAQVSLSLWVISHRSPKGSNQFETPVVKARFSEADQPRHSKLEATTAACLGLIQVTNYQSLLVITIHYLLITYEHRRAVRWVRHPFPLRDVVSLFTAAARRLAAAPAARHVSLSTCRCFEALKKNLS
jgi:hypothetical protein